jgi:DNA-binding SARP family transcriptional activator
VSGLNLGLLGPVELRRDGVVVPVGAAKKRMVLAVLGLAGGQAVSTDRLIDAVWSHTSAEFGQGAAGLCQPTS